MEAPGSFILLWGILFLLLWACLITGTVWFLVGWRKKAPGLQWLSALPFGFGLFIIAPILLLASALVLIWFFADGRAINQPGAPTQDMTPVAPRDQNTPVKLILHLPTESGYLLAVPQPPDTEQREPAMSKARQAP